ncbi:hypothetical protein Scep_026730 [Stephania cephalantha]|uniref:Uncharacterized protein n=1 Tax=Stephania cephalantha TaxID=152367 RepID=A0AAP0EKS5_9MAGN
MARGTQWVNEVTWLRGATLHVATLGFGASLSLTSTGISSRLKFCRISSSEVTKEREEEKREEKKRKGDRWRQRPTTEGSGTAAKGGGRRWAAMVGVGVGGRGRGGVGHEVGRGFTMESGVGRVVKEGEGGANRRERRDRGGRKKEGGRTVLTGESGRVCARGGRRLSSLAGVRGGTWNVVLCGGPVVRQSSGDGQRRRRRDLRRRRGRKEQRRRRRRKAA